MWVPIKNWEWYFHTIQLYESYDTNAVVKQIKDLMKTKKRSETQ